MKKLLLILIISSVFFPLLAKDFFINIDPVSVQYKKGCYKEFVYQEDNAGEYKKLSELDWNVDNNYYIGTGFSTGFKNLCLSSSFYFAKDEKSGVMYDSDWVTLDPDLKTNYSISDNTLNMNFGVDVNLKYSLNFEDFFYISPMLGYMFDYIDFSACNGHGWYGNTEYSKTGKDVSWDSPDAKVCEKLFGIDYKKKTSNFYFGVGLTFKFPVVTVNQYVKAGINTNATSLDTHYGKNDHKTNYIDVMKGNQALAIAGIDAVFNITEHIKIKAGAEYLKQGLILGPSGYNEVKNPDMKAIHYSKFSNSIGESSVDLFSASLGLTLSF